MLGLPILFVWVVCVCECLYFSTYMFFIVYMFCSVVLAYFCIIINNASWYSNEREKEGV